MAAAAFHLIVPIFLVNSSFHYREINAAIFSN